ncbi:unnamed protein product, partial [Tilletia controversa]
QHAESVRTLAVKAKINTASARRYIDGHPKHFRSKNSWNSYQAWRKHRPASASSASFASYRALTSSDREGIKTWEVDHRDDAPHKSTRKLFNAACRDLTTRIRHLQVRYGIRVAAVASHEDEGIQPFLAISSESGIALGSALNSIKTGKTGDDLAAMYDRAVKLKVWTGEDHAAAMAAESTHSLPASQRLAKALIEAIHSAVGPALAVKDDATQKKWRVDTKNGTRLRYKNFFSFVAETGCCVKGWPKEALVLLGPDAITDQDSSDDNTSITVWEGSLLNTARWTEEAMKAVRTALSAGNLVACVAQDEPGGDGDE